jgi:hypothetical protein
MLFMIGSFIISGFIGTLIALRLMAIDAQEQRKKSNLTVRGRLVVGILIGIAIATFVVLVNGMWWDCTIYDSGSSCQFTWGY